MEPCKPSPPVFALCARFVNIIQGMVVKDYSCLDAYTQEVVDVQQQDCLGI